MFSSLNRIWPVSDQLPLWLKVNYVKEPIIACLTRPVKHRKSAILGIGDLINISYNLVIEYLHYIISIKVF